MDAKLNYVCAFAATYPSPTSSLKWKITKKELKLKSRDLRPGSRILGWVFVTFDEIDPATNRAKSYEIAGYFKAVLQHPERRTK